MSNKTTISVIKADIGSFPGHSRTHPLILQKAAKMLKEEEGNAQIDIFDTPCGGDTKLIMTHTHEEGDAQMNTLACKVFTECTRMARKLYGAGQDILSETFSGNVKGIGPGVVEMKFEDRGLDPVLVFIADKTDPGAWNFYLYKMFTNSLENQFWDQYSREGSNFWTSFKGKTFTSVERRPAWVTISSQDDFQISEIPTTDLTYTLHCGRCGNTERDQYTETNPEISQRKLDENPCRLYPYNHSSDPDSYYPAIAVQVLSLEVRIP